MPIRTSVMKSDKEIKETLKNNLHETVNYAVYSQYTKATLRAFIKREEDYNVRKKYQDQALFVQLGMDKASKEELIRYLVHIKTRKCVTDLERKWVE